MDRKLQRHRADSLRQHGFLVGYSLVLTGRLSCHREETRISSEVKEFHSDSSRHKALSGAMWMAGQPYKFS